MARNEEKAFACLNRWTAQKRDIERMNNLGKCAKMGGALPAPAQNGPYAMKKRPRFASDVTTLKECDHWRTELRRGIAKKIAKIQNPALGEHRTRDLNDEINKDIRGKTHWDQQIKTLGGPDYRSMFRGETEVYGAELASHSGYKYFGAARDLPGVRELFEKEPRAEAPLKTRKQMFNHIQPDYYGNRDEDDVMLLAEQEAEHEGRLRQVKRWKESPEGQKQHTFSAAKPDQDALQTAANDSPPVPQKQADEENEAHAESGRAKVQVDFKAYVDVPTMNDIERMILKKKKQLLMNKYLSTEGQEEFFQANRLLQPEPKEAAESKDGTSKAAASKEAAPKEAASKTAAESKETVLLEGDLRVP